MEIGFGYIYINFFPFIALYLTSHLLFVVLAQNLFGYEVRLQHILLLDLQCCSEQVITITNCV